MSFKGDLFEAIRPKFEKKFIYFEEVLDSLCCAWVESHDGGRDGSNVVLWGPGGYGKSEMSLTFAREVYKLEQVEARPFVKSFGASTADGDVWGGYDLNSIGEKGRLEFALDDSFLAAEIAILEELFDLPGRVIEDLKDTLSAREFRRGALSYLMKTRSIIVCTNHNPDDIEKRSESANALLQRFPTRLEVKWPKHEASDYLSMFNLQVPELRELAPLMANIIPCFVKKGTPGIAPRLAISGLRAVKKRAKSRGRSYVVDHDFEALRREYPFNKQPQVLSEVLPEQLKRFGGSLVLNRLRSEIEPLVLKVERINKLPSLSERDMEEYVGLTADLTRLRSQIQTVNIPGDKGEGFTLRKTLAELVTKVLRDKKVRQ